MSDSNTSSGGVGFGSLLLIAFIVLKLCGIINWSWWWVLSPAWIGAGIVVLLLAVLGVFKLIEHRKNKKIVTKSGQLKSKWQERLDQMQEAQRKMEQQRNQSALDDIISKNKSDEFRAQNKL